MEFMKFRKRKNSSGTTRMCFTCEGTMTTNLEFFNVSAFFSDDLCALFNYIGFKCIESEKLNCVHIQSFLHFYVNW